VIYLASPYSHPDPAVREQRFREACRAAAMLLRAGHAVFSPIANTHPLVEYGLPTDWSFWEWHDREHLARCDGVVVLLLDGWEESVGVRQEIRIARTMGKPVQYLAAPDVIALSDREYQDASLSVRDRAAVPSFASFASSHFSLACSTRGEKATNPQTGSSR
jgi:hypothetical protein